MNVLGLTLISTIALGAIMAAMAVGVIVSNRSLRGSCGGPAVLDAAGEAISCGEHCTCAAPEIEVGPPSTPGEG